MFFKSTNAIIYFVLSTRGETDGRTHADARRLSRRARVCFYKEARDVSRRVASRRAARLIISPNPRLHSYKVYGGTKKEGKSL